MKTVLLLLPLIIGVVCRQHTPAKWPKFSQLCAGKTGRFKSPTDPSQWYRCLHGNFRNHRTCPTGQVFDEAASQCTTPSQSTYLLVWSGPDNPSACNDAVVVLDATPSSPTFGSVVGVAFTPTSQNEPHHVGVSADGAVLAAGGIQAFINQQPDIHFFNITNPLETTYMKSLDPAEGGVPDSFVPIPAAAGGGFLVSLMGGSNGTGSGRLLRINDKYEAQAEFPASGSVPDEFNPHGVAVDAERKRIVTADYLDLSSTLYAYGATRNTPAALRTTFRVWSYADNFTDIALATTYDAGSDAAGMMTAAVIGSTGVGVSSSGKGTVFGVNLTNPEEVRPVYFVSPGTDSCVFSFFRSGTRALLAALGLDVVQLVNTTDPWEWTLIQEFYLPEGSHPHAVSVAPSGTLAAVTLYYWDQEYDGARIGTLSKPGSKQTMFFDIATDGDSFSLRNATDFKTAVNAYLGYDTCGAWRPHGVAWKSYP